jgi:hypothetical protein
MIGENNLRPVNLHPAGDEYSKKNGASWRHFDIEI